MVARKKKTDGLKQAPLRIGIDARLYDESGVGRYIRNLISEISKLDSKNNYYIFLLKKNSSIKLPKNFTKVEADFGWYGVSEQVKYPKLLQQYALDVMHFTHFNVPILYKGKFILTVHDLIHQHFAMKRVTTLNPLTFRIKRLGYNRVFRHAILKAAKIITPSRFVQQQLTNEWNISQEQITVTPEGVEDNLLALIKTIKTSDFEQLQTKFKITGSYLYYVGNAHPHKNLDRLMKAFVGLKKKYPKLLLVMSGPDHYFWERLKKEHKVEGVIFTGYVTDRELVTLYKNATAYLVPSLEEGFGIPLLEAFACGCPVVSSKAGSLKEVGGDAALYFDPKKDKEIQEKIEQVLKSEKLRDELREKGKKRYKEFSWQKMAKQTLALYTAK